MTTEEFLKECDIDQLRYVVRRADEMIRTKENEDKVPLWVVSDEDINYAAFKEDEHPAAVDRLVREIREHAARYPGTDVRFELLKIRYRTSEVDDMLALATPAKGEE